MKIAVLILMHKNEPQLLKMLKYFNVPEVTCFIHCDLKYQIDIKKFEDECRDVNPNTFVQVVKRESCYLSSYSLVKAELNLLQAAIDYMGENHIVFDYFHLMSGQDYFLSSVEEYLKSLESAHNTEFLDIPLEANVLDTADGSLHFGHFDRIKFNSFRDCIHPRIKSKMVEKLVFGILHVIERFITVVSGSPKKSLDKANLKYAIGSAWWILSRDFVNHILVTTKENGKLIKILKKCNTPEECFFQTVYLNSEFAEKKTVKPVDIYINFLKEGMPYTGHPYILLESDYDLLLDEKKKGSIFARKFDLSIDSKIFDKLDKINGMEQRGK